MSAAPAQVEIMTKATKELRRMTLRAFIAAKNDLGVKGKLNMALDLADGYVFQNRAEAWRLVGLPAYHWQDSWGPR